MKILAETKLFREAFAAVARVAPARSPKPALRCVRLEAREDGTAILSGTDLEVWIDRTLAGIRVDSPGACLLPAADVGAILRAAGDDSLAVSLDGPTLRIAGLLDEFTMQVEDAATFPIFPDFPAAGLVTVSSADLLKLIRRTVVAVNLVETRFQLGGCHVEIVPDRLTLVATDGHYLVRHEAPAEHTGVQVTGQPIVPHKALRALAGLLDDDDTSAELAIADGRLACRWSGVSFAARLLTGRFPIWRDFLPAAGDPLGTIAADVLLAAIERAGVMTSPESRGVAFRCGDGRLVLSGRRVESGSARVEVALGDPGTEAEFALDWRYLADGLRPLGDVPIRAEFAPPIGPLMLRSDEGWFGAFYTLKKDGAL